MRLTFRIKDEIKDKNKLEIFRQAVSGCMCTMRRTVWGFFSSSNKPLLYLPVSSVLYTNTYWNTNPLKYNKCFISAAPQSFSPQKEPTMHFCFQVTWQFLPLSKWNLPKTNSHVYNERTCLKRSSCIHWNMAWECDEQPFTYVIHI